MKRSFIWLGLLLLLLGSLVACGKSDDSSSDSDGSSSSEQVTISAFMAEDLFKSADIMQGFIDRFEEQNPDIKVKLETVPHGETFERLRVMVSTDEMPDIYQINVGHSISYLVEEAGYLYDLSELESSKNFSNAIQEGTQLNGKHAAFSMGVGVLGFHYNADMLKEAGYDAPPKTWDELMDLGEKLKANNKSLLAYSAKWSTGLINVFHWTFGNYALKDPEFKEAYLSNSIDWSKPEYREVLLEGYEKFKQLNEYVYTGSFTSEYGDAQQAFINEESAMVMGGSWDVGQIRDLNPSFEHAFMNLPYDAEEENSYIYTAEDGLAINSQSEDIEAAKTFLDWLFSKEIYEDITKTLANTSAMEGVGELDPVYIDIPQWLETDRVISFANTGPIEEAVITKLGETAQKVTFDGDAEQAADEFINEYNSFKE